MFAALVAAPVSLRAQDAAALTDETWQGMIPVLSDYRAMLLEYNKNPGPDSPWFAKATDLDLARLPEGVSAEDNQALDSLRRIAKGMERMRGTHNNARAQSSDIFRHEQLGPLQLTMLQGIAFGLAQTYDEWTAAHDRLATILKDRKGYRLPRPAPPIFLRDLRAAAFPISPVKSPARK